MAGRWEDAGVVRGFSMAAGNEILLAMDDLPLRDASVDLVVAHGVWNLARSAAELRRAIAEAARVTRPGAGLFVFTFSRATLAPDDQPVPGEPFVFTQFTGEPQCFLTETDLPWILAIRKNDAAQSNWPVTALTDGRASARRSRRSE